MIVAEDKKVKPTASDLERQLLDIEADIKGSVKEYKDTSDPAKLDKIADKTAQDSKEQRHVIRKIQANQTDAQIESSKKTRASVMAKRREKRMQSNHNIGQ